jgi:hypothetical protein
MYIFQKTKDTKRTKNNTTQQNNLRNTRQKNNT